MGLTQAADCKICFLVPSTKSTAIYFPADYQNCQKMMCHPSMVRVVLMSLPKWRVGWTQRSFQVGIKFINLYINVFVFWDYPCHVPSDLYDSDLIPDKAAEACYDMRQHVTPFTQNRPSSSRPPRSGPTPSAALAGGAIPSRWQFQLCHCWFRRVFKEKCLFRLHLNLWCFLACPSSAEFAFGFWFLVIYPF